MIAGPISMSDAHQEYNILRVDRVLIYWRLRLKRCHPHPSHNSSESSVFSDRYILWRGKMGDLAKRKNKNKKNLEIEI